MDRETDSAGQPGDNRFKLFGVRINPLSALLFFGFFTLLMGWKFALIIMALLMFHEYGHAWAMWRCGVPIAGMTFMPPFGLAVAPAKPWETRQHEAFIGIMGPAWGLVLTAACWAVGRLTGSPWWSAVAYLSAMINLFNLAPINPLDGGRIVKSCAFSISDGVGFACQILMLASALLLIPVNLLIAGFVLVIGYIELRNDWRRWRRQAERERIVAILGTMLRRLGLIAATPAATTDSGEVIAGLRRYYLARLRDDASVSMDIYRSYRGQMKTVAERFRQQGSGVLGFVWYLPTTLAAEARGWRKPWFGKPQRLTAMDELLPPAPQTWIDDDTNEVADDFPLAEYLAKRTLVRMPWWQAALFLVAYVGVAIGLLWFLVATAPEGGFAGALKHFR